MSGYKAYLSKDSIVDEDLIHLDRNESHHLCRVLRLRHGDMVSVLDGDGTVFQTIIENADPKGVSLKIESQKTYARPNPKITLLLSVPKLKSMDLILKACVEIGIDEIKPVLSDHSAFHLDAKKSDDKVSKWKISLIESIKQCENPFIPILEPITKLDEFLESDYFNEMGQLNLVASLEEGSESLRQILQQKLKTNTSICLAVGPEGDFSKNEYDSFRAKGFFNVRLSRHVLRTESAVFYALSVVDQFVQELK